MMDQQITLDVLDRLCRDIPDWKKTAIIAMGCGVSDLEEALAWVAGDDETTPHRHLRPQGAASRICDILIADEETDADRER